MHFEAIDWRYRWVSVSNAARPLSVLSYAGRHANRNFAAKPAPPQRPSYWGNKAPFELFIEVSAAFTSQNRLSCL